MNKELYKKFVIELISAYSIVFNNQYTNKYMAKHKYKFENEFYIKNFHVPKDDYDKMETVKDKLENYIEEIGFSNCVVSDDLEVMLHESDINNILDKQNKKQLIKLLSNVNFLNTLIKKVTKETIYIKNELAFREYLDSKLFKYKESISFAKYIMNNYYKPSVYFKPMKKLLYKIDNYVKEVINE